MTGASEEDQGPHRAVVHLMMMMMKKIAVPKLWVTIHLWVVGDILVGRVMTRQINRNKLVI